MSSQNTSTSSSQPPQAFLDAYKALMGQATGVANQPLQQYSGPIVAGLSPDQQSAIATIQQSQGIANDYENSAADLYNQAATPLTTNAPAIAGAAGAQANGIAGGAGTSAQSAAAQGTGIAQAGAIGNAGAANQAAGTNVWNQVGPVTGQQIQNYETPYTQQVVDATQAQFNNQNQQTNQGVIGNAISKGAWGGDRAGVAQGIAAGQEALAQAPVIAGLQNQGYSQALGEANTQQALQASLGQSQAQLQANTALGAGNLLSSTGTATGQLGANTALGAGQLGANTALGAGNLGIAGSAQQLQADQASSWLAMQAGQGMAGLGTEVQNNALSGAAAQMGAGNLEQSIDQSQLNVPYQQFLQQQQYPFQTTQWLTSILQGLGGASGGTSSTTSPGPSGLSQGIGALGAIGSIASLFAARGGAIPSREKRAGGGGVVPPDLSVNFIPDYKSGIAQGGGPPKPPSPKDEQQDDFSGVDGLVSGISKFKNRHGGVGGLPTTGDIASAFSGQFGANDGASFAPSEWSGASDASLLSSAGFASGGGIARRANGGTNGTHASTNSDKTAPWFSYDTSSRGIAIPHLASAKTNGGKGGWSNQAADLPTNLTTDYGNAAADSSGKSTLPSTTYYPPVDPWFSNNPANRVPSTATGAKPGDTMVNPDIKNPTNTTIGGGTGSGVPTDALLQQILGGSGIPGLKRGGGIAGYATDGEVIDPDADTDDDYTPGSGIVSRGTSTPPVPLEDTDVTGGKPFTTHPIEKQPAGNELPEPPPGIAAKPTYTPRKPVDAKDQPESKDAGKLALLAASLGIMAGKSPHALQNIGAGGLEGVKEYTELKGKAADRAEKQAEAADTGNYRAASLSDAMDRWQGTLDETKKFHTQTGQHQTDQDLAAQQRADEAARHNRADEGNAAAGKWNPGGVDAQGNVVAINDKTGEKRVFEGMKPKPGAGSQSSLSPATLHDLTIRAVAGEPVTTYIGNSPGNKAALLNSISEYSAANNVDPKAITAAIVGLQADKAGARTLAQNLAKTESSVVEADKFADNALTLSAKVNRGRFIPVNAALQAFEKNTGDPDIISFGFANNSLINAYATAVAKGGQKTDSDTQEARHLLSIAQSPQQYAAAIKTLKMETHAAQAAPEIVRQRMQARIAGQNPFAQTTDMDAIGGASGGGGGPDIKPPSDASIQYLKANPGTAAKFDEHFGPGASKQYLGGP